MITEDYISFEVAKLLKEKGFDENCTKVYINKELRDVITKESIKECTNCFNHYLYPGDATAPTLQMALKWLREVHHIFISIDYVVLAKSFVEYTYEIHNMRKGRSIAISEFRDNYETYEKAVEAAIKYCLINLIK